jgi:hypothetical protein
MTVIMASVFTGTYGGPGTGGLYDLMQIREQFHAEH